MDNVSKKKVKLNRLQVLVLYFFLFACIGWLMETSYAIYNLGHFVKEVFCMALFALFMVMVL